MTTTCHSAALAAAVLVVAAVASPAFATDEDEATYPQPADPPALSLRWSDGASLESANGDHLLRVGGLLGVLAFERTVFDDSPSAGRQVERAFVFRLQLNIQPSLD